MRNNDVGVYLAKSNAQGWEMERSFSSLRVPIVCALKTCMSVGILCQGLLVHLCAPLLSLSPAPAAPPQSTAPVSSRLVASRLVSARFVQAFRHPCLSSFFVSCVQLCNIILLPHLPVASTNLKFWKVLSFVVVVNLRATLVDGLAWIVPSALIDITPPLSPTLVRCNFVRTAILGGFLR